jgi:hypothetical protein
LNVPNRKTLNVFTLPAPPLGKHALATSRVAARVQGTGFRVQRSGFAVQGSEFRVQGSGFMARGLGFRVQGSGFIVQGSGFRVQGSGFRVLGLQFTVQPHSEGETSIITNTATMYMTFQKPKNARW